MARSSIVSVCARIARSRGQRRAALLRFRPWVTIVLSSFFVHYRLLSCTDSGLLGCRASTQDLWVSVALDPRSRLLSRGDLHRPSDHAALAGGVGGSWLPAKSTSEPARCITSNHSHTRFTTHVPCFRFRRYRHRVTLQPNRLWLSPVSGLNPCSCLV
jgi:hypothetical protein